MPTTTAPDHEPAEWDDDRSDAPYDDPGATDAVRFAGCSIDSEMKIMEVQNANN